MEAISVAASVLICQGIHDSALAFFPSGFVSRHVLVDEEQLGDSDTLQRSRLAGQKSPFSRCVSAAAEIHAERSVFCISVGLPSHKYRLAAPKKKKSCRKCKKKKIKTQTCHRLTASTINNRKRRFFQGSSSFGGRESGPGPFLWHASNRQ